MTSATDVEFSLGPDEAFPRYREINLASKSERVKVDWDGSYADLARLYTESADLLFPQFGEHKQIVRCRKRAAELLETDGERGPLAAHAGLQTTA